MASRLTLIVAITPSSGIGRAGELPWPRIKSEMAYFARVTKRTASTPNAVIMGRKTWESIPARYRPLPGRINVVVTRQAEYDLGVPQDKAFTAANLQDAIQRLHHCPRIFVGGGAQIYEEALKVADRILLTRIKQDYECDTFFPKITGWELQSDKARDEWIGEQNPGGDEWSVELWTRTV